MEKKNAQKTNIELELTADVADGIYSNLALITHSQSEFIIDFTSVMPGVAKARVKSRIILTPQHAKRLMKALSDNVHRYENMFGSIEEPEPIPASFMNTPTTEA
ncbi:DUF3467 domain-containing protein [bacterium]|nr:DUF3467 domain-containing protein [bacterium]MBD5392373.1 DUF3467 domain-containing protein [bacterium]